MSRSLEVSVKPAILSWARETIGITVSEIAKKMKVKEELVEKWESGKEKITLHKLEKLAHFYKRPLAIFFLSEPPEELPLPEDFRAGPSASHNLSKETLMGIRRVRQIQSIYSELSDIFKFDRTIVVDKIDLSVDPEKLAGIIRQKIKVDINSQYSWENEEEALNEWKQIIEERGVLVLEIGMPENEVRGFSLDDSNLPVIVLNYKEYPNGRIFSLFHEYAHIMLRKGGMCDMFEDIGNIFIPSIEIFCNQFAGAFLVPRNELVSEAERYRADDFDTSLRKLSRRFKVSQQVILRRFLKFNIINKYFYEEKQIQLENEFREFRRRQKERRFGRKNFAKQCIRENGLRYLSTVLNAYRNDKITLRDVSHYLNLKLKYLPQVEQNFEEAVYKEKRRYL